MSKRSEDAAIKAYPETWILPPIGMEEHHEFFDFHAFAREIYKEGYEQAEKDSSLTPEDIIVILNLAKEHSPEETAKLFNDSRQ